VEWKVPHREPEYRRRVRDKTAEDQKAAEREWQEAAQDARIEKIIGSVERLVQQVDRYTDEKAPENKRKGRWERAEVIGLWAAAFVGVAAIWYGTHDASESRKLMQVQLDEMQAERRPWVDISVDIQQVQLSWSVNGVQADTVLSALNSGNSPASNAGAGSVIVIGEYRLSEIRALVKDKCASLEKLHAGSFIFMKDSLAQGFSSSIDMDEIKSYMMRPYFVRSLQRLPLYLIICSSYTAPGEPVFHHTGRIFQIREAGNPISPMLNQDIPRGHVELIKQFAGDYTD
jgi:hypothetical protein